MAPSEGCGGDPAAGEGSTSVTRSSRSGRMGPTITRYFGDRPAAAPTAGECDADGVEEEAVARRGCYPNPAPRRPTPAAPTAGEGESRWLGKRVALEETSAVPRCARYRRPRPFGEGTSAAGAEEAVLTCGGYGDAAPRRPTPVGAGIGIPTPAASCIPVPSGGRGGGGGRGLMDSHDYHGTSSPPAFNLAPTSDLAPKDKVTAEMECMEEGYLAKTVQGYAAKAIKAGEVICVNEEEDYKPSAVDAPAATSESKATPEPAVPKVEEKVPAKDNNEVQLSNVKGTGPDGRILKADIEDYLASVGKGGKSKSFAASGLDYTDIPNAQIRKVTANRLLASEQTIPHYYLTVDTCVDKLTKLRGELNPLQEASGGKKISINDLVIKGNIARWLKKEGDKVSLGGILCGAETEKVTAEMECMEEGYLAKIVQGDGAKEIKVEEHVLSVKMDNNGENEISWEKETSQLSDFVCSDRGGCFGSKKGKLNYISKMNYYLRVDCVSDIKPISNREARSSHSRYEVLKERCGDLAEVPSLLSTCASIKSSHVDILTQIFMDICGSTISLQENLSKLDINLLSEVAFVRSGIKPRDFYSTCAGKVLEPNCLLSCYQIPRDSTIKLNARLRGGCAGHNWDDVISDLDRYRRVPLPGDLLLPEQAIIHPQVEVKYLARLLQVRCRKVLIYLCRKHYSGHSFGGNFSSQQIMFDSDGNVRIHAALEQYSQPSALLDYNVVSGIFDRALGVAADKHPTDFFHLIHFLSVDGPTVDCQSKAVIAFVTNHISLLTYSERINHSAFLDLLITRLGADDLAALKKILVPFDWDLTLRQIPAMNQTYTYIWWKDEDGIIRYPYKNHGVSLLRFSHNFFKHRFGFTLDELEAAFSLVTSDKNFLAHLLFKILIRLKNKCQQPCPASVETFIDEVIEMLGDHTVDCEMVQGN